MSNFAQLNVLNHKLSAGSSLSEGNLRNQSESSSDVGGMSFSTLEMATGKFYMEVLVVKQAADRMQVGVINSLVENYSENNTQMTNTANKWCFICQSNISNGGMYHNSTNIGNGTMGSFIEGDIGQIAIDVDAGKVWFGRNGTFFANDGGNDGDPAAGTNESFSGLTNGPFRFAVGSTNEASGGCVMKANFGEQGFKYTPPTGFKALSQDNLTTPTNFDALVGETPEDYFKGIEYTGTGNALSVTGLNFRPDFVWIKNSTSGSRSHLLSDSIRGSNNLVFSDSNVGATTNNGGGYLTSFDTNGFTVSAGAASSENASSHVAWCWKAGGTPTATNSAGAGNAPTSGSVMIDGVASTSALAGTIAADKITANTKSGFSIVKFTGNGSGGATVAHGLGATPEMILLKSMTITSHWRVYHKNIGTGNTVYLNLTNASINDGDRISAVDSTTFGLSSGNGAVNGSGNEYIAYCFHSVEGFSRFGQYLGNAANNGPYIECGFKPAFVIVRNYNIVTQWYSHDNVIGNKLGNDSPGLHLKPNSSNANDNPVACDFFASGFKMRTTGSGQNGNNNSHIYMAFAEMPAKFV